jgi:adenosyl cobinamide kinase/adenosyl cobinamide phosphate guanylyltransferase
MSTPILILGESGSGKSASLRNMKASETLLIQSIAKPLPFRDKEWAIFNKETKKGNIFVTDKATDVLMLMNNTKRKVIVIDDFQYILANELMRRYQERGYDKFSEIGYNGWNIISTAAALASDVRVYVLGHSHMDENGKIKIKTPGKLLDTHSVEGMFSIVLRSVVRDNEYLFSTRNNGSDTVKTPIGLFDDEIIPNDLALVDAKICKYYELATADHGKMNTPDSMLKE